MKDDFYTLAYALVLGTLCATLLTAAGRFTRPYREANAQAEEVRNILSALGIPYSSSASAEELLTVFESTVEERTKQGLRMYSALASASGESSGAVAFPVSGPGLWGPIKGFLALEDDLTTVRALTFYQQEETPGLGGEIASKGFQEQFVGKKVCTAEDGAGIEIRQDGSASARNEVNGISGATLTCQKVEDLLNQTITRICEERGR